MAHLKRGRYALALEESEHYRARKPDNPWGYFVSATALMGLNRMEDALAKADRAIELDGPPFSRVVRASALSSLGLFEEACTDFRTARQQSQVGVAGASAYGYALVAVRSLEDAIAVLSESAPPSAGLIEYALLGDAYRLLGDMEKAAGAYEQAIRRAKAKPLMGDDSQALFASCLALMGRLDEAAGVAEELLAGERVSTSGLLAMALIATLRQDSDRAYDTLSRALAVWPQIALRSLTDPYFTPLLSEKRFRELLAWALGAQRETRERVRDRLPHLFS